MFTIVFLKTWSERIIGWSDVIIRLPAHTLMYGQRMLIKSDFTFRLVSSNIGFECLPRKHDIMPNIMPRIFQYWIENDSF